MFSPICQQSISSQVLGSREKKSFLPGSEVDGGVEAMLVWLRQWQYVMSCWSCSFSNLDASLVPPCLLLNEISLCIQCSAVQQVRFHISWQYLLMSQRESHFPRKPRHVIMKCFAGFASLIFCFLVSPDICDYTLVTSQFEQTQEKPESSGAALSKQLWPACLPKVFQ